MQNSADMECSDLDPLALQTDAFLELEHGGIEHNDSDASDVPALRRSQRYTSHQQNDDVEAAEPLFPITKAMRERIKRMKQRMLVTLKLSDEQLTKRRKKRAKQTKESRQRAVNADTAYRRRESDKKMVRKSRQRAMETTEQTASRMAKKREEGRRYLARRRESETTEQREARREYQRVYSKSRQPIKFV